MFEGVVDILRKTHVRGAEPSGSGVRLLLDGPSRSSLEVDHVIAGTGFHVNLDRLTYLPQELRARIATFSGYPVLTRAGESTVPGLYFVGAPAAFALGPSMRFIAGTHNVAGQLTWSVARHAKGSRDGMGSFGPSDQVLQSSDEAALNDGLPANFDLGTGHAVGGLRAVGNSRHEPAAAPDAARICWGRSKPQPTGGR